LEGGVVEIDKVLEVSIDVVYVEFVSGEFKSFQFRVRRMEW
jgi:hypothetical protein